tara:strand:- start:433 stop:1278 length:846 start_codon:yes stop_codon:yes gene_type:complete
MIDSAMETNLCVIAGGGILPRKLADNFDPSGDRIFFLAFRNVTDPEVVAGRHHEWLELGEVQKAIDAMHRNNVDKVVMAGPIQRPALSSLALDIRALQMLAKGGLKAFGDDGLLSLVAKEIEKEGIKVIGIEQILPGVLTKEGLLAGPAPTKISWDDIKRGLQVLNSLGPCDVGQSIAVQEGIVLAIEAIEGTDQMIERAGSLQRNVSGPILIKISKTNQDKRVDLPTAGPETVNNAIRSGFQGLALEANNSLLLDKERVIKIAEKNSFFVIGVDQSKILQ